MGKRAIFLDRDGTLNKCFPENETTRPPCTVGEVELLPGVREACDRLKAAGFLLIIVTNQPDVARGTLPEFSARMINQYIAELTGIDDVWACYHDDGCKYRKPQPTMILEAAEEWGIDLAQSWMVGDRQTDVEAGQAAGCNTVLLDNITLLEFTQWLLGSGCSPMVPTSTLSAD